MGEESVVIYWVLTCPSSAVLPHSQPGASQCRKQQAVTNIIPRIITCCFLPKNTNFSALYYSWGRPWCKAAVQSLSHIDVEPPPLRSWLIGQSRNPQGDLRLVMAEEPLNCHRGVWRMCWFCLFILLPWNLQEEPHGTARSGGWTRPSGKTAVMFSTEAIKRRPQPKPIQKVDTERVQGVCDTWCSIQAVVYTRELHYSAAGCTEDTSVWVLHPWAWQWCNSSLPVTRWRVLSV